MNSRISEELGSHVRDRELQSHGAGIRDRDSEPPTRDAGGSVQGRGTGKQAPGTGGDQEARDGGNAQKAVRRHDEVGQVTSVFTSAICHLPSAICDEGCARAMCHAGCVFTFSAKA